MVEGINMASFLKQMEELEKLKKKAQVAQKLQTHKGVSSGTPSSMPRAIDNLPKVNASQKAGMAAEKATRVFLQNSPDAYLPRPQQVGPCLLYTSIALEETSQEIKASVDNVKSNVDGRCV